MKCPAADIIELYVLDKLDDIQRKELTSHLVNCDRCRERIRKAKENESLLCELRKINISKTLVTDRSEEQFKTCVADANKAQSLLGDKYRVLRKVAQGASGDVFEAVDPVLNRQVAVKFLKGKQFDSVDQQPWREARLNSQLNHPNVAQIYHIGQAQDIGYIVMEWVNGTPLTDAWSEMPTRQKLGLLLQALEGIAAAHTEGIIHRDIKPSNILVDEKGKVKVLDFSIALDRSDLNSIDSRRYCGTPSFSAPEQVTVPVEISTATDVFALGVLMYELLTGTLPFTQTDKEELFNAIRTAIPELPNEMQEDIPVALQNICLKALEKNPHRRYADAAKMAEDINKYLRGEKIWSRPSFITDKLQQDVFMHRQKLKVWQDNELLTQKEADKLEGIYERMISPADPSIIEARKLSLSQVCLYLGGWITVLGSFVLFYKTWDNISVLFRPLPAVAATAIMIWFGVKLWLKNETRLAVGFLATGNLLAPIAFLLTLAQWELLSPDRFPWGVESISNLLTEVLGSHLVVGNIQLYVCSVLWLAFSLWLLRTTRSSIFVWFSIAALFVFLTSCYLIAGMIDIQGQNWAVETIAGRYLWPGIVLFVLGVILNKNERSLFAWAPCVVGVTVSVISMTVIAISESTLFGWIGISSGGDPVENKMLSLCCNGIVYLTLAGIFRKMGTRLLRTIAQILNWLGPMHILGTLRALDSSIMSIDDSHTIVYRILLPISSVGFVLGSVLRQMKSFFFSGLAGIAAAIHKITIEYLKDTAYFAWPISLIITGITWMIVSWIVPVIKAAKQVKQ